MASAVLCLVLLPYSLLPVHIENPEGNTDYVWPANSRWSKMTEGVAFGTFDEKGYNNREVIENPDILVLGSSHTEATNVLQTQNFSALLSEKFAGTYTVYNQGVAAHHFLKVCKYLPRNAELNPEAKYIIIETGNVMFDREAVDGLLNGTVDFIASKHSGLVGALQKLPFPRAVYHQLTGGLLDLFMPQKTAGPATTLAEKQPEEKVYDDLFGYIQEALKRTEAQLIIMYHPTGILQQDGAVSFQENDAALAMFGSKCQEYGISFVDMTQPFLDMYATEHKLPHGFITGEAGSGHINADGHAKIAEELEKHILAPEEAG
ncbi:MAG: hypothetical protein IKJ94_07185 [Oscillospiraceae bacterium]|nr:hypothetical protein [Oscillospiraceae bacterium]